MKTKLHAFRSSSATIVVALCAMTVVLAGCQKERPAIPSGDATGSLDAKAEQGPAARTDLPPGTVLYSASEADRRAQKQRIAEDLMQEQGTRGGGGTGRPGQCSVLIDIASMAVKSVVLSSGSFCTNDAFLTLEYDWYTLETFAYQGGPIAFDFEVQASMVPFNTYAGTATLISATQQQSSECGYFGECPILRHFVVTINGMTGQDYSQSGTQNTVVGTSSCASPVQISEPCTLDFPSTYYTGNPARVYVQTYPGSGQLAVLTDCSTMCPPPHTTCPLSGTFKYRLVGSPNWITQPLPVTGLFLSVPFGTYEYECVLQYSFGSSLPLTGTITI